MQLLSYQPQQAFIPVVKGKPVDLEDEILLKISCLPESEQAKLLGLAARKLQEEKTKEAFNIVVSLKDSLSKGLAVIEFLPYLTSKYIKMGRIAVLKCVKALIGREDKISLIQAFIKQLQQQERRPCCFEHLIEVSGDLALIIKEDFEVSDQILLQGKCIKLLYYYVLNPEEKRGLLEKVKSINVPTEKYLLLLSLLEEFPLEQEEISELSCLALSTLSTLDDNVKKSSAKEKNTVATVTLKVKIKDKIRLLSFLDVAENKRFGKQLYEEISQTYQSLANRLENLNGFASHYHCKEFQAVDRADEINFSAFSAMKGIVSIISLLCEDTTKEDEEYYEVVEFLAARVFFKSFWADEAIQIMQNIKSPIIKVDAGLLLLSKLDRVDSDSLHKKLIAQVLNTIDLIEDEQERIILSTTLLEHLSKKSRQAIASALIEQISLLSDEATKAELLVGLLQYLTPRLGKKAFEIARNITSEFDRAYACIAFAPYLTESRKQQVIQDGLDLIDKLASPNKKSLIIKQLIKSIKEFNEGTE